MNLILFTAEELGTHQHLTLKDHRFNHIRNIHRAKCGDFLRVGELNGLMGSGEIVAIDDTGVELAIELTDKPPAKIPLNIVLALPRPKMTRRIFRTVAELGVSELCVINSYKVEKSYWQSPSIHPESVNRYLVDGLQQAKDTVLPRVSFHSLFKPFVEDQLPAMCAGTNAFVAHPGIGQPAPRAGNEAITLAIGPEGGFTDYEVDKFIACGFTGIDLGSRILRVETAIPVLVSRLYNT